MSSSAHPSEFDDLLEAAANDVGCGEPKQRDPKHSVIVSVYVARILGDRLFEHVGVPDKMKQPNEHFLRVCSTFFWK